MDDSACEKVNKLRNFLIMRKIGYITTLFVATQLIVCTSMVLWIIWYIYQKNAKQTFAELIGNSSLVQNDGSYTTMVVGILVLAFIIISSTLMFIETIKTKMRIKQGHNLSSAFTHELMTPLTCINMNLEALVSRKGLSEENRNKLLLAAFHEGERLKRSISKIFEINKIEYRKQLVNRKVREINVFFKSLVDDMIKDFPSASINYSFPMNNGECFKIDEKYLKLVFNNLMENSVKYSRGLANVSINIAVDGRNCTISFKDDGIGIPPTKLKNIFDLFFRINKNIRGNGMGLYIARNIIKMHKGKITAYSEGENKGALFVVTIPLSKVS